MLTIGGPTCSIDWRGIRFLIDPTFDPAGTIHHHGPVVLEKTVGPAVAPSELGPIDVVLLTHDQHADNLDDTGRTLLPSVGRVITTVSGAERLGRSTEGLAPWSSTTIATRDGGRIRVTATPARHGPEGCEPMTGEVIGFLLEDDDSGPDRDPTVLYLTGDTVWYEGVAEVAHRAEVTHAFLFAGAARLEVAGPAHLTMTAEDVVATARPLGRALLILVHHDGWAHFSEDRACVARAIQAAGFGDRLRLVDHGRWTPLD
jgi:L-ascorbate metabolism protein UlaG (beta-lactamase superfamily)